VLLELVKLHVLARLWLYGNELTSLPAEQVADGAI
jgi:hypothetical protein